ncbi:MAG: hypothetical protein LBT91_01535 [Bifidobacteriaceae bacterium]|nr:hypothetical protein [Bifidobacteriaceae bacterium]
MKASLIGAITSMALMFCLTNIIHNAFWLFAIIYLVYETVFVGIRGIYNYLEYKKLIH